MPGGPLEFVRNGETGLVVAPRPEALGVALRLAWSRPETLAAMGEAGRRRAALLNWDEPIQRLLSAAGIGVTDSRDPLRRLAQERGRLLGELGVRPEDLRWQRLGSRGDREPRRAGPRVSPSGATRAPLAPARARVREDARLALSRGSSSKSRARLRPESLAA